MPIAAFVLAESARLGDALDEGDEEVDAGMLSIFELVVVGDDEEIAVDNVELAAGVVV